VTPHTFFSLLVLALVLLIWFTGVLASFIGQCGLGWYSWNHHKEV